MQICTLIHTKPRVINAMSAHNIDDGHAHGAGLTSSSV